MPRRLDSRDSGFEAAFKILLGEKREADADVNAQVAEKWAREHFVFPEQVFVTGSSAGAYGAVVNSLPLQEFAWPSSDFAVLGDAGSLVGSP